MVPTTVPGFAPHIFIAIAIVFVQSVARLSVVRRRVTRCAILRTGVFTMCMCKQYRGYRGHTTTRWLEGQSNDTLVVVFVFVVVARFSHASVT